MARTDGENPIPFASALNDVLRQMLAAAKQQGREEALAQIQSLVAGSGGSSIGNGPAGKRGPGRPRKDAAEPALTKSGTTRKNPWAGLSPEARLQRINAIRKGRGLPAKEKL